MLPEGKRDESVDSLRTAITVLVVLHHSVLAYAGLGYFNRRYPLRSTAPIVDAHRWVGFDGLLLFNDGWFMAAMFFISGMFVLAGLRRHGRWGYLRRRAWRLGLPFVAAVLVVMPLAYYPSFRLAGFSCGILEFWLRTVSSGPWPGGPAWFLWVLLALDAAATACAGPMMRLAALADPTWTVVVSLTVAALGTVGLLLLFGAGQWLSVGPFAVQASRIVLYGTAFAAGMLLGPRAVRSQGVGYWIACAVSFVALVWLNLHGVMLGWMIGWTVYGLVLVTFCTVTGFLALGLAGRFLRSQPAWGRHLGRDAFGIYVLHYWPMLWLQYALLPTDLPGPIKALIVFAGTLALAWAGAAAIRTGLRTIEARRA